MTTADAATVIVVEAAAPPSPPTVLEPGCEQPVAVWRDGDLAAVLSLAYDDQDSIEQYIEVVQRACGTWSALIDGSSDWPAAYGARPTWVTKPMLTGFSSETEAGAVWSGIAPFGVTRVRASFIRGSDVDVAVEPVTGAFLIGGHRGSPPTVSAVG